MTATDPVPVGTSFVVIVSPPEDATAPLSTVTIGGMTTISSYMNGIPEVAPPSTASPHHDVDTHPVPGFGGDAYTGFVVDADPKNYAIQVNVTYTNGDSGVTTINFTSARPAIASLSVNDNERFVESTTNGEYNLKLNRMIFTSATKAHADFGGSFMVMQLVNVDDHFTDANNNPSVFTTGGQWYIDDSRNSTLGMDVLGKVVIDLAHPDDLDEGHSWTLQAAQKPDVDFSASDVPGIKLSSSNKSISLHDKFKTYLMYMPPNAGVWVALSKIEWEYTVSASNPNGNGLSMDANPTLPNPGPATTPSGEDAFPSWSGKGSQITQQ